MLRLPQNLIDKRFIYKVAVAFFGLTLGFTLTYQYFSNNVNPLKPLIQTSLAASSDVVDGTSAAGSSVSSQRKIARTTNGSTGKRTFALGFTGSALNLYYTDNPDSASPSWASVVTIRNDATHYSGDLLWDETNNVLYVAYGREAAANNANSDIFFRRISSLNGSSCNNTASNCLVATAVTALDGASGGTTFSQPYLGIIGDSSTTKVGVFANTHTSAGNPTGFQVATGTINSDSPTWDTAYAIKSWTATANTGILGVERMNTGSLIMMFYNGTDVLSVRHDDSSDAQATSGWDALDGTDNSTTTISNDDSPARGTGSIVADNDSNVAWFAWQDSSNDINTRRWNGSSLDTEQTPVASASALLGPSFTTDYTYVYLIYQNPSDGTQMIYQRRDITDGTSSWSGTTTTIEDSSENLGYPSSARKITSNRIDVIYTTQTSFIVRHTSDYAQKITISGVAYENESSTLWTGGGKCDGSTQNVSLSVDGNTKASTTCNASTGAFSFSGVGVGGANSVIAVYLDTSGGDKGVLYTKSSDVSSNITGLPLTKNRVWIQSESAQSITNTNINVYDKSSNDTDIPADSDGTSVTVDDGVEIHVNTGDTFAPGGNVTVSNLHIKGTYTGASETLTLKGSGSGSCSTDVGTIRPLCIDSGSFTAPSTTNFTGTSGNSTLETTTYQSLGVGTTSDSGTGRTFTLGGNTTASGTVTIGNSSSTNSDVLAGSTYTLTLSGSGSPLNITSKGSFQTDTSTVDYQGTSATVANGTTYNNLSFSPPSGTPSYTFGGSSAWYNGSWLYRKPITIEEEQITGSTALTDFTVLVSITDANLQSNAQSDADDILFTSSDGTTKLSHEIESYTAGSGVLVAWVKVPSVSATADTTIYMYYGNSGATNQQDVNGSWNTGYQAVYHLKENPATTCSSTYEVCNSKSSSYYLDASNMESGDQAAQKINGGLDFDGTNEILSRSTTYWNSTMTVSGWVKFDAVGSRSFVGIGDGGSGISLGIIDGGGSQVFSVIYNGGDSIQSTLDANTGTWYYVTWVRDTAVSGAAKNKIFVNGSEVTYGYRPDISGTTATGLIEIGGDTDSDILFQTNGAAYVDGQVDEVRISGTAHTTAWINAEYNNQNTPSSFTTVGSQETPPSSSLTVNGNFSIAGAGNASVSLSGITADFNGNITIGSGDTLVAPASSFTVAGNFTNNGTYTHSSGTIVFDTTATATISSASSMTFYNFTSTAAGKTIKFQKQTSNTPVFTVSGLLTLTGSSGNQLNIESDTSGTQWLINHQGTESVSYVYLKDSGCNSSTAITTSNSFSVSNVGSCWENISPVGVTISGNVYSDEAVSPTAWTGSGKCDGSSIVVSLSVNGGTKQSTTCNASTAAFTFTHVNLTATDQVVTVFIDNHTDKGALYTKNSNTTSDITGLKLTKGRVWLQSDSASALTASEIGTYDKDNDADIPVTASTYPAVSVDSVTSATQNAGSSLTFSHTVSGSNRLLAVSVGYRSSSITSVTYNGTPLSQAAASSNTERYTRIWTLVAPSTGTHNVVITFAGDAVSVVASAISFNNVNQLTPVGNTGSSSGTATTQSVTVSSSSNELVLGVLTHYPNAASNVPSNAGGQTSQWALDNALHWIYSIGATKTGSATTTLTWTSAQSFTWSTAAFAIKSITPDVVVDSGYELHVNSGDTFTSGNNNITADSLHIKGTYNGSGSEILTLSGAGTGSCTSGAGTMKPLCIDGGTFSAPQIVSYSSTTGNASIADTTYYYLELGTVSDSSTGRTFSLIGATTVNYLITIGNASSTNADTLDCSNFALYLYGQDPLSVTAKGTFIPGTSNINVTTGSVPSNIEFYDLTLNPTEEGTLISFPSGPVVIDHDLILNQTDLADTVVNLNENDTDLTVGGDVLINTNTTLVLNQTFPLTIGGSFENEGILDANGSSLAFSSTSGGNTISGSLTGSSKPYNIIFQGVGGSWQINSDIDIENEFTITHGTVVQGANVDIFITGDITLENGVTFTKASGTGIFKMDGPTHSQKFNDKNSTKQNLGDVQIGASPGTTTLLSDMSADSVTIPTGDRLNTKGYDITAADFFDCQGTCTLDLTDTAPNNEGDGTRISVGGDWTMSTSATFTQTSTSTIEMNGSDNQTLVSGGKPFHNLTINNSGTSGSTIIASGNISATGNVNVLDGIFDLDTNDPVLDVDGSISISSGATFNSSTSSSITLAQNFTNNGGFSNGSQNIIFDTTATSTISGVSTSFYDLTSTSPGKTIKFQKQISSDPLFSIDGTLTLTGDPLNKIKLESDTAGSQWVVNFSNLQTSVKNVSIKDSGCYDRTQVVTVSATNISRGNNGYCWGLNNPETPAGWYNASWGKRKKITIDPELVNGSTDLTDFPVLVNFTDSDLQSHAQGDADDILFTSADGITKLAHEVENYSSGTGALSAWIKIPALSTANVTELYMYYSNGSATNQQNVEEVWTNNYAGVWHFNQNSGSFLDSTSNNNDSSTITGGITRNSTGKLGYAVDFNGTANTYIQIPDSSSLDVGGVHITVQMWAKYDTLPATDSYQMALTKKHSSSPWSAYQQYISNTSGTTKPVYTVSNSSTSFTTSGSTTLTAGAWRSYTSVLTGTGVPMTSYVNGTSDDNWNTGNFSGTILNGAGDLFFGNGGGNSAGLEIDGQIDEARISSVVRSPDWIATEYNNQNDPNNFYAVGLEESSGSLNPVEQKKVTGGTVITTTTWTNETQVQFTATATDPESSDTLYLCVEKDTLGSAFSGTEDGCGTGVSFTGTAVNLSYTMTGITDASEYHWQARIKDSSDNYSSWVTFGGNSEATRDFGTDSTAPTTGTVYDGTSNGVDADQNNTGSLSTLSANWSGFNTDVSGLEKYEYSIGTTAGGTNILTWTDNSTSTTVNAGSLTLHTGQPYFFNVRAKDNAGNTSSVVSSNSQFVTPSLTFSLSSNNVVFTNLDANNNYQDTKSTITTTSTNAYNGYVIKAYRTSLMSNSESTIQDFGAGTYASPASWAGSVCSSTSCGFGYTSSDTSIGGVNKFDSGTKYAPFATSGPGDVVADHTEAVSGSSIVNEAMTITNKVAVSTSQPAGTYSTTVVYTIVPQY